MRIRRRYGDRYLARGRFKGIQIQNPGHLTDRERRRIEKRSFTQPIAVLDPTTRLRDSFAIAGCFALDPSMAISPDGDEIFDTAVTEAYRVAAVVDKGVWTPGADWYRDRGWDDDPLPMVHLQ